MAWEAPKIDWTANDRFNITDFNRIKNNLMYLQELGCDVYKLFSLEDMGDDKTSYAEYWKPSEFNLFESNLELIKNAFPASDIGIRKTFFENAPFIDYIELNRIESAMLNYYQMGTMQKAINPRLAFRLGNMKGVKV